MRSERRSQRSRCRIGSSPRRAATGHAIDILERRALFAAAAFTVTDIAERIPEDAAPIVYATANGVGATFNGYVYTNGQPTNLRTVLNASTVTVHDMNASGAVLGLGIGGGVTIAPFIYKDGQVTLLTQALGMEGTTFSAFAINDNGDVAGAFIGAGGSHVFRTENGFIQDLITLDTPVVTDLTNNGKVVGKYMKDGKETAFLFDGALHDIPTLQPTTNPFAQAEAVSSTGLVTGFTIPGTVAGERPFLYDGTTVIDLNPGGVEGVGYGINDAGDVVGAGAIADSNGLPQSTGFFVARGGTPVSIDSLIGTDATRWHIEGGQQFDPQGGFTAYGLDKQTLKEHILFLTPTNAPPDGGDGGGGDGGGDGTNGGKLTTAIDAPALPAPAVPGDKGTVKITLNNTGTTALAGTAVANLFLSLDGTIDDADYALPAQNLKAKLAAGASQSFTVRLAVPAAVKPGSYFLLARTDAGVGIDVASVSNATSSTAATFQVVNAFGAVGQRQNVKFAQAESDGSTVSYSLSGPGMAELVLDADGNTDLVLSGTSSATKLTIAAKGGSDGVSTIDDVTATGGLGSLTATKTNITGTIDIGGSGPATLKLASARGASLTSSAPIASLAVIDWLKPDAGAAAVASITAPSIGKLSSKGEFSADLIVSGLIGGISVGGNGNSIAWRAAGGFGAVTIKGGLTNSTIDAGLSADGTSAVAAAIKSIAVTGPVTGSRISAGFNPTTQTIVSGGQIGAVKIKGAVSADTTFRAALLPKSVTLGGSKADPALDARFAVS